jgi:integrase/recombinase XerD
MITIQEYLQQHHPASTVKSYEREINIYLQHHPKAKGYSYKEVMQYIGELRSKYSNGKNINRILQAIKKYYNYLHYTGQRKDNPSKAIHLRDNKTKPVQLQDLFTAEELQQLLQPREERYPFLTTRNKVIMSLLVNQGLKIGEIVQLEINHIKLNEGTVFIPGTGHTNKRTLQLKAEQIMLLHEYMSEARGKLISTRTNNSNKLLLSKLGHALSISEIQYLIETFRHLHPERHLTAQTIRMSVVMNLLNAGNDVRVVQVFAGHMHPDTTEKYKQTHIETLKTEIQKHHPLQ